ncbi:MAG: cyclase family protein [Verrucomicrobiia bacterium]|jgi:arylformamidase
MKIHDVSVLLHGEMLIWPGDPKLSMSLASSISEGDVANVTRIEMGAHTGTHMDAPFHFKPNGSGIDKLSLEVLIGPCRVFDLSSGTGHVTRAALEACDMASVTRALFKTRNSRRWANDEREFDRDFAAVTAEAAEYLVARGIKLVGVDYLSVEAFSSVRFPVHHTLLGAGVVIIEGLNLSGVTAGDYELIALPLKLKDADGAPARVVLRSLT